MNRHIQKLSFAALSVSLCACSMLGERQESTRLDIDGDTLPQIKVIAKKTSTDSTETLTGEETTQDPFKFISLNTRYVHPTLDASKVVKEKKIGLMHVMQGDDLKGQKQSLPPEIDTASLFFGLGGKITGKLNIIENPDDDLKSTIKYDESAVQAKHDEMIQTDPACEGRITELFAQGEAKFDLSQTQIADLANNTIIEEGKSLRDSLDKEIKEELARKDPSKANEPIDVTKTIFGNLAPDTQKNIRALFKPDVGLLVFIETKHFSICIPESGENIRAYLLDNNGHQTILPEHVKVAKGKDGLVITIRTIRNNVTKSDLDKKKLSMEGQDEEIPLGQLKFGEKEVPVFSNTHNEITEYVFHLTLPASKETSQPEQKPAEETTETPAADVKKETPATPASTPPAAPAAVTTPSSSSQPVSEENPKPVSSSTKSKLKDHSPDMTSRSDTTSKRAPVDKPKDVPATASIPPVLKGDTVRTDSAKTKTPVTSVALDAPIVTKYKRKSAPVWYSPLHNGYEKNFYVKNDDEWIYNPNGANSNFWDNSRFPKQGLTDGQVQEKCKDYEYIRNMVFSAELLTPAEFNKSNYITGNFTKSYKEVLYDQLYPEINYEQVSKQMVEATTNPPSGARTQDWELKVCFDTNKPFQAFWSAKETRSNNFYWQGSTAVFTGDNPNHWYPHASQDHFVGKGKPAGFNSDRSQHPLSNLNIIQNPNTKEWNVVMQLGFKRSISTRLLMAYINPGYITDYKVAGILFKTKEKILEAIEAGFANSPGRTETFVYGGFTFDPAQKGEQYVELQSPTQISSNGLVSPTDSFVPWSIGHIMFPGESNVLNLPVKLNKNVASNNVLAKK